MSVNWTREQLQVIESRGSNLLVRESILLTLTVCW